ncbi:MAG: KH domain-containing protein, partial [Fervidicoccaceae archaeon]
MLGEEKRPLCSTKIHLRVPLERVGVLIGERGEVKRRLEEATGTIITIDSDNGIVIVEPVSPGLGAEGLLRAQEVIKAIAAGFSPERAFRLLEEDQMLVVIDLKEATSGEPHHMT